MKLKFLGATQEVTGSCILLETKEHKYLFDCGMYQGPEKRDQSNLFFNPHEIDGIFLSHAHIDHSGLLPLLWKRGYNGPIYSTTATKELTRILLLDSAKIQAEEENETGIEALYNESDVKNIINNFEGIPYKRKTSLSDLEFSFCDAGHILGSAITYLNLNGITLTYTGDLGHGQSPILNPPTKIKASDYLIIESTYGNKTHSNLNIVDKFLSKEIKETMKNEGKLLIPVFAVGRSQEILYYLWKIKDQIKDIPIFFDTPMGTDVTELYSEFQDYLKPSFREYFLKNKSIFHLENLKFVKTQKESRSIASSSNSSIILAASGMLEGGRVMNHIESILSDTNSKILFSGYQPEGTLGRKVMEKKSKLLINDKEIELKCQICKLSGLSAHADKTGLLSFFKNFGIHPQKTFIVHGEKEASLNLFNMISHEHGKAIIPSKLHRESLSGIMVKKLEKNNIDLKFKPSFFKIGNKEIMPFVGAIIKNKEGMEVIDLNQYNQLMNKYKDQMELPLNTEIKDIIRPIDQDQVLIISPEEFAKNLKSLHSDIFSKRKIKDYIKILEKEGKDQLIRTFLVDLNKNRLGKSLYVANPSIFEIEIKKFKDFFIAGLNSIERYEIIKILEEYLESK
ncbi:MAG: MBL fold metallo-hydrolase [Candidatus Lokiarchaeota archaeon]|nr:MBL fold metallo-hydrolase [Candidatus Lokiarchaeota archaeon]